MRSARMVAIGAGLLLAGCGDPLIDGSTSSVPPYAGPMTAEAAVGALECDGDKPYVRAEGDYDGGLESVQPSAEAAFENFVQRSGIANVAPVEGYRLEREEQRRALLSYDVNDRTKVAVFLSDGIRDFNRDEGWGVVAWAQCDPAELPAEVTEALNIGVWEDAGGRRVPVRRLRSFQGPEHCDWTDITFLLVGPDEERGDWYLRDPAGKLATHLRGSFEYRVRLPEDAVNTGWRREGRELWIGPDKEAAYLVDVEDSAKVERWPAARERIGCA